MKFYCFQSLHHPGLDTGTTFIAICVSGFNLYLYCFFGNRTTDNFLDFGDILWDLKFYEFPIDLQKLMTVMIGNTREKHFYHGFNILNLSLTTFNAVNEQQYFRYQFFYNFK